MLPSRRYTTPTKSPPVYPGGLFVGLVYSERMKVQAAPELPRQDENGRAKQPIEASEQQREMMLMSRHASGYSSR